MQSPVPYIDTKIVQKKMNKVEMMERIDLLEERLKVMEHSLSLLQAWRSEIVSKDTEMLLELEKKEGTWHEPHYVTKDLIPEDYNIDYVLLDKLKDVPPLKSRFEKTNEEWETLNDPCRMWWPDMYEKKDKSASDDLNSSMEYYLHCMSTIPDEKLNSDIDTLVTRVLNPEYQKQMWSKKENKENPLEHNKDIIFVSEKNGEKIALNPENGMFKPIK